MLRATDPNKHIIEEIVRHFGYLPELYEDARSEKHKKQNALLCSHSNRIIRRCTVRKIFL